MSLRIDLGAPLPAQWSERADLARTRLRQAVENLTQSPPGFLELLAEGSSVADDCLKMAGKLAKFEQTVILGIGGSALGARTIRDALAPQFSSKLIVLDNIDPDTLVRTRDALDPEKTAFLVVSKSGSTAETAAQFLFFHDWLQSAGVDPSDSMVILTDPKQGPLRALVKSDGYSSLEIPPRVGGRFSVLTPVGLLPAAILGIEPEGLLRGGRAIWKAVRDNDEHPLLDWVVRHALRGELSEQRIQVLMSYVDRMSTFGDWFAQLWGESLGKKRDRSGTVVHRGSTPLPAVGATDQHSLVQLFSEGPDDKQFLILGLDASSEATAPLPSDHAKLADDFRYLAGHSIDALFEAERIGTGQALETSGRPVSRIQIERLDAQTLGALFVFFELATVLTAELLEVDPYDQPGVEAGKWIAFARMGREGFSEKIREELGLDIGPENRGTSLY